MANQLNSFKTFTAELNQSVQTLYTAPSGFTSIMLMSQISNITSSAADVTFIHTSADGLTDTELVKDFAVPGNDATSVTVGKLVLEEGESVKALASANSTLKSILSILETLNA